MAQTPRRPGPPGSNNRPPGGFGAGGGRDRPQGPPRTPRPEGGSRPHGAPRPPRAEDGPRGQGAPRAPRSEDGPRSYATPRPPRTEDGPRPQTPRPPRADNAPRPQATYAAAPTRRPAAPAPRPPEAPKGTIWLYGIHAIDAALGNPARRLRRLLLTEEAEATLLARRKQPWPLQPERADRAKIDGLLGRDAVHQGAALLADPLGTPLLSSVLERPGPVLVLDQVNDPRNIGAVLRSAAAFGACCVISQDRNAPEETGALAKAASGALETVPLIRAVNLARTLVALKAAGLWTVGLDSGGAPLSGPALSERRVALVLGAEGPGMRRLVRETCDEVAGLAMPGSMESLNVSAAATVALYELNRRS